MSDRVRSVEGRARGSRAGLLYMADEGERAAFQKALTDGMREDDAYNVLTKSILRPKEIARRYRDVRRGGDLDA